MKISYKILIKIKNNSHTQQKKKTLYHIHKFKIKKIFQKFQSPYNKTQNYTFSLK